ncbi:AsmA family protein [Flexibacterium corallicola]|uniref:AsmA family protein n=1 Tax=Flexibacterium corallicola TaxID=3037259 RepID=UPI00286F153C|nr:AsmA family protein [Pseudovibrio sp. M1P-2-3]
MNSVFIGIGTTLIVLLVAALFAPMFIDWSDYRAVYERYAERVLGHEVTILGDVDISLLPTPRVSFSDVRVGQSEDPLLVISRFSGKIEIPPLLQGKFRVLDMVLDKPDLRTSLDEFGRLDILQKPPRQTYFSDIDPSSFVFDRVEVIGGKASVTDARTGKTYRATNANMLLSARSLEGPYKADGALTVDGVPYTLRVASGRWEDSGRIRVKTQISPASLPVEFALDGNISHEDRQPVYDGAGIVRSIVSDGDTKDSWSASGHFRLSSEQLSVDESEILLGSQVRPLSAQGRLLVNFTRDPDFDASVKFKQVDLDRMFAGGPQDPLDISVARTKLTTLLDLVPISQRNGRVHVEVPSMVLGGSVLSDFDMRLSAVSSGWKLERFTGLLPGGSKFETTGTLKLGVEKAYRGQVVLNSRVPQKLAGWLRGSNKGKLERLDSVKLEGRLNVDERALAFNNMRLEVDGKKTVGRVAYDWHSGKTPLLSVDVDTDRLDVNQLQKYTQAFAGDSLSLSSQDLSLRVFTDALIVEGVSAKSVVVQADLKDDTLMLEQLRVRDFAGAYLTGSGKIENLSTTPSGDLNGTLQATSLNGVVNVLKKSIPDSALVQQLARAAPALAPVNLQGALEAYADGGVTDVSLNIFGQTGLSDLDVTGHLSGRVDELGSSDVRAEVYLAGADSGRLLRQLGVEVLPIDQLEAGHIQLVLNGVPRKEVSFGFNSKLAGAQLKSQGKFKLLDKQGLKWSGSGEFVAQDIQPLALMFGHQLPVLFDSSSANLRFTAQGQGGKFQLEELTGELGNTALSGELAGAFTGDGQLKGNGNLALSKLDLKTLSSLALGGGVWENELTSTGQWPETPLGTSMLDSFNVKIDVSADQFQLTDAWDAQDVSGQLSLRPSGLFLEDATGAFAGGTLSGGLQISRFGEQAAFSTHFKLADAAVEEVSLVRQGRAVMTGDLDVVAEMEGSGRSVAAILSSLSGSGSFTLSSGEIRGLNPQVFDLVIAQVDRGLEINEGALLQEVEKHLENGNLDYQAIEGNLSITSGRMRARNITMDVEGLTMSASTTINLQDLSANTDISLKKERFDEERVSATPQISLIFSGDVKGTSRSLDVGPFESYLNLRAIEQNVKRIEVEQEKIAEQERLVRQLKREQEENERLRELELEDAARRELQLLERQRNRLEQEQKNQPLVGEGGQDVLSQKAAPAQSSGVSVSEGQKVTELPVQEQEAQRDDGIGSFLATVERAINRAPQDGEGAVQGTAANDNDLPELAPPITVGPHSERTVLPDSVRDLPPLKRSGREQILVAPGDDDFHYNYYQGDAGLTPKVGVPKSKPPVPRKTLRFRELPGGRIIQLN